ncbi:TonB-dependent receptor domain-containing protein [Fluviicola taffensis]|uniref:TonB-dependent receptor n=1 Tax=Fluviicola taffensis (strain DSM 16823 / NCIMB 13979 / RW262) TaxID=755732 RepID=F2IBR0_FLUTR|nr:TonB-dependent receptor [Fluviicola taffensis]AEA45386.1 TonB-dependent receptor [Fluviicola taffensis DSM 16823]
MRFTLFLFFLALSFFSFSQTVSGFGSIDGRVLDSLSKTPLEYTMIRLFSVETSQVATGIYTDENGSFVLEEVKYGNYYLVVTNPDYITKTIRNIQLSAEKPLRKVGAISLVSINNLLDEVVIQTEKNQLQLGIEKKVYNVGDDISVTGGTVTDVLNNVPSVEVDQDGGISLRGDANVTILIDGKPSNMSGGNGKSVLEGIPASSIERIEIVTNPSAKYDPDGTSGIINIVLKKNVKRGINGNVAATVGTGNLGTASASLNLRNTKFNLYGNYAFSYKDGYRNNYSELNQFKGDTTLSLIQRRVGGDINITHTARVGMDIYLKDRNTLSWSISGNAADRRRTGNQNNIRNDNFADTSAQWNRVTSDPTLSKNIDFSLGYKWNFKDDKGSLDVNVYESLSNGTDEGFYQQTFTIPSDSAAIDQHLFSNNSNDFTTVSLDFVRAFKSKFRVESGLKMIQRNMILNSNYESKDSTGVYMPDTSAIFNYKYLESIYSAYGIIAGQYKKFKYQAGLRFEYSIQAPNLVSKNESFRNEYFNLFPSATIRYSVSKSTELSLGYSKRINRPNFDNLNPFTSYADPYNLRSGNPALKPENIHSIDLGLEYNSKQVVLAFSLYQRYTSSVIQRVKVFYEDGTSRGTYANIDNSVNSGGEVILQYKPFPIWRNMISFNGNYIKYTDDNTTTNWNREGFVFGMKFSSTLDLLKKTLTLQVNFRYSAPSVTAQGTMQPRGSVDFSADKSLFDGKWGIGLRVTDIFNTQGFSFQVDQPSVYQSTEFKWETRRLILSVRYRFGKTNLKEEKKTPENGGGGFDF